MEYRANEQGRQGPRPSYLPPQPEDEMYMRQALALAQQAFRAGDTPIGCVIVHGSEVIGQGKNERQLLKNPLAHAEIEAISQASKAIGDWRLEACTMYVTLEPCPMCAGAIVQARIPRIVIGAMNPKAGCCGSVLDLMHQDGLNHQVTVTTGVLAEESRQLLQDFFEKLRHPAPEVL